MIAGGYKQTIIVTSKKNSDTYLTINT
jgi:hypothetical protein